MKVYELNGKRPRIQRSARILDGAIVAGDVVVEEGALLGFNAVVYAENAPLRIGKGATIADGALVHAKSASVEVGDYALVGHGAQICGGSVGARGWVGINAVLLDDAELPELSMLAADSLLLPGEKTTPRSRWGGRPATHEGERTDVEIEAQKAREQTRTPALDSLQSVAPDSARFD